MMRFGSKHLAPPPPQWAEPRGVYWAKHLVEGRRLAYAVDSRGEVIKRLRVHPSASEDEAVAYLWEYLDAADPTTRKATRLELVRSR